MEIAVKKYKLQFKTPAGTSRGVMTHKRGYFVFLRSGAHFAAGECSFIEGLSYDDLSTYEEHLKHALDVLRVNISSMVSAEHLLQILIDEADLQQFPSIIFGLEMLLLDYVNGMKQQLFVSPFTHAQQGIPVNGLVWMNTTENMLRQVKEKVASGYSTIKLKVGALEFDEERELLKRIRQLYPPNQITIRLDANGAFTEVDVWDKLDALNNFNIHSIEQPVKPKQWKLMQQLCAESPIPIALDEELIGINDTESKLALIYRLRPPFVVLKPSLLGGFDACNEWIWLARETMTAWWATSALESNLGLNAISQWVATKKTAMVQGLGTGSLYINNIPSPLFIQAGSLYHNNTTFALQSF